MSKWNPKFKPGTVIIIPDKPDFFMYVISGIDPIYSLYEAKVIRHYLYPPGELGLWCPEHIERGTIATIEEVLLYA